MDKRSALCRVWFKNCKVGTYKNWQSLLNCQELIDMRSDDSAADIDALLKWQIINVLIGNCDGHCKNLSLLRNSDGTWRSMGSLNLEQYTVEIGK